MNKRSILLAILIASTLLPRIMVIEKSNLTSLSSVEAQIEPRLYKELSETDDVSKALLQFDKELTQIEICYLESHGIEFTRHGSSIVHIGRIYSASLSDSSNINTLSNVGLVRATSGTKQFFPSLTSSVPSIGAPDVWSTIRKDGNAVNGSGVTVAVIDTGALGVHPTFWRPTTGEISVLEPEIEVFYADLDGDTIADPEEGPINHIDYQNPGLISAANEYMYIDVDDDGIFRHSDGDRWLSGVDANTDGIITLQNENVVLLGEPKIVLVYDQYLNIVYQRGVNLTSHITSVIDTNGHGTHVASTIAGGQPGLTSMIGVAPGADLIIIRSPLQSSDIIDAIHFAITHDADIINMSFSSYLGYLDGTDLEDLAISEAFRRNGTLCTMAAGNLGGKSKHASFQVEAGSSEGASLSVSNPPLYSFVNILWHSDNQDEHVILTPPEGEPIDFGKISDIAGGAYFLNESGIKAYVFAEISLRGLNSILIQIAENEHTWSSGTWTVNVENPSGRLIRIDAYAWDNVWSGSNLRFTSHVDNSRTISSPGTADLGVTVAWYDESSQNIDGGSSRGPRIDGIMKPDVAAPGTAITAADESLSTIWYTRQGTSMAAPHIAGVLALLRQASEDTNGWVDYTALIEGAGGESSHYSPSSPTWGHGLTDALYSVVHAARNGSRPIVESVAVTGQSGIFDVNIIISDEDTSINQLSIAWNIVEGDLEVLDTGIIQGNNSVLVSVDFSSNPSDYLRSILFNISDGENELMLPPIALTGDIGVEIEIRSAQLDDTLVAVGPFIQEYITGQIVIKGYSLVKDTRIAFLPETGPWLNFSLTGSYGIYDIRISPQGFSSGDYEVYAVVESRFGETIELEFAMLSIIEDYSMVVILGLTVIGIAVSAVIWNRYKGSRI